MIVIAGQQAGAGDLSPASDLQREIFRQKLNSRQIYSYSSKEELLFELGMRQAVVEASYASAASGAQFASFAGSRCNPVYWELTPRGAFVLRPGVRPSDAIRDIFINGGLYAYECAVAIVIVLYKAILEVFGNEKFNRYYPNLILYSWHLDSDLRLVIRERGEAFPGDVLYFDNPDVSPLTPEYQGENAVLLGPNLYFGHGIGIATAEQIIAALNSTRRLFARRSAYLLDQVTSLDYPYLYRLQTARDAGADQHMLRDQRASYVSRIGARVYIGAASA
jgi:protein-glutamine gamma-glutamyltransferase